MGRRVEVTVEMRPGEQVLKQDLRADDIRLAPQSSAKGRLMHSFLASSMALCGFACLTACSSTDESSKPKELSSATAFDLDDIKTQPTAYDFIDFKPNVQKLILAGAPETE